MAANTTLSFSLQAKDWEVMVSLMYGTSQADLRKIIADLINYYAANANPQGNTLVPITVKEKSLIKMFELLYGNTVSRVYNDTGGSVINRIVTAIRAANNAADNYISTELAARDTQRTADQVAFRKSGREYLMMEGFDNN